MFHIRVTIATFVRYFFLFSIVVSTLLNFVRMFVRAHDENRKQIEYEKKKAEKEAAEKEKLKLGSKESEHLIRTPIKSRSIK